MFQEKLTRRAFVGSAFNFCMAAPIILGALVKGKPTDKIIHPYRKRLPNPYMENGKPVVVIVQGSDFPAMLSKGLAILGGLALLGPSKSVIIKPNFVFDKISRYPTTTDEQSVLTVIKLLQKEGFKDITVADRRGKKVNGRAGGKFEWSGLNDKAEGGGFKTDSLLDNEVAETIEVRDPRWKQMPAYGVIKKIYNADLIINMPTIKRHTQTHLTCALKNMMGVLDVPTTENMHLWGDQNKAAHDSLSKEDLSRRLCLAIAEASSAINPELTIIDARAVLCRNHVGSEQGNLRVANRLIISGDPLAADIAAAQVLKEVCEDYDLGLTQATFAYASQLGIGVADPARIVFKNI